MSLEALKGSSRPFDEKRLQVARPHPGQAAVARNMRALLADSEIAESHRDCGKVQDAYSLRCMPQVHGATRDALAWVRGVHAIEINSVTDNPSVFLDGAGKADLISGRELPRPAARDRPRPRGDRGGRAREHQRTAGRAAGQQGSQDPALSTGLTPFLAAGSGLHSGFMIAQVASASLVSENKVLWPPRERRFRFRRQRGRKTT